MTNREKLENAVKSLNKKELSLFRKWFARFDAVQWDRQIKEDEQTGKLDRIAKKASKISKS